MRASMQTAIYFLLVTICPEMHLLYVGDIVALASPVLYLFPVQSYQQPQAAGYLFYSFFFIGAEAFFSPSSPSSRYSGYSSLPFSVAKLLVVSAVRCLGWVLPYWILFGTPSSITRWSYIYRPFTQLLTFGKSLTCKFSQPWELAILGYLLVMFIVSAVHCIIAGFEDKIRTRAYLQFHNHLTIFLFLLIALQPYIAVPCCLCL